MRYKSAGLRATRLSGSIELAEISSKSSARDKPVDICHVTRYNWRVIKTFSDKHTYEFFITGKSKRLPADLLKRAMRRLEYVDLASSLEDLKVPPSNRLHALKESRAGQYSISINDQWRICFRFKDSDAYDVEITDYH